MERDELGQAQRRLASGAVTGPQVDEERDQTRSDPESGAETRRRNDVGRGAMAPGGGGEDDRSRERAENGSEESDQESG